MSWSFTIPGQPISINHSYKIGTIYTRNGPRSKMVKIDGVEEYQTGIAFIVKAARPSGWIPPDRDFVRLGYRFFLNPDMDADNVKKLVNDAFAKAIGINDRWLLTCDLTKEKVAKGQQRTEIEVTP